MRFDPGRIIMHRNTRRGRIGWVRSARVISDDDRGLLVWIACGAAVADEVDQDGRGMRRMPFADWVTQSYRLAPGYWNGPGVLKLHPPGAAHSVWWFRADTGAFTNWYVNLEEPAVRWDDGAVAGIDVVDQDLDLVIGRDWGWRWKDEEEFAERMAHPAHYWVADEAPVRAEGERVIKLIEAREFPFDGTWCDFAPDPDWPVPTALPIGWDRPVVARGGAAAGPEIAARLGSGEGAR